MTFRIGTPHARGAGYLINNKDLKSRQEADIRTCNHCQAIINLQEWKHAGGWCAKCNSPLCNNPGCMQKTAMYGCVPFLRQLEQHVNAQGTYDQIYKKAGFAAPVPPSSPNLPAST